MSKKNSEAEIIKDEKADLEAINTHYHDQLIEANKKIKTLSSDLLKSNANLLSMKEMQDKQSASFEQRLSSAKSSIDSKDDEIKRLTATLQESDLEKIKISSDIMDMRKMIEEGDKCRNILKGLFEACPAAFFDIAAFRRQLEYSYIMNYDPQSEFVKGMLKSAQEKRDTF